MLLFDRARRPSRKNIAVTSPTSSVQEKDVEDVVPPPQAAPASPIAPTREAEVFGAGRAIGIFVAYLAAQLGAGVIVFVGVAVGLVVHGSGAGADAGDIAERMPEIATLPSAIAGNLVAAWIVFRMTRRSLPGPLRAGALASIGWSRSSKSSVLRAAAVGFVLFLFYAFVLIRWFPRPPNQAPGPLAKAAMVPGWPRFVWVFLVLTAPPIEEFLFRGVLLTGFAKSWGRTVSAILVTVIFVSLHLPEVGRYWPALCAISSVAVLLLAIRLRSGSLAPAVAMHTAYNFGLAVMALLSFRR